MGGAHTTCSGIAGGKGGGSKAEGGSGLCVITEPEALEQLYDSTVCFISSDLDLPFKAPYRNEQGAVLSLFCVFTTFQVPNRILRKWKLCPLRVLSKESGKE